MYSVTVRDHFMIAHSFSGEAFGPAQRLHGATYLVDLELRRRELDADGVVVDIGRASDVLKAVALGARAVLVGRPILWGLTVNGEQGAAHVLEILRRELDEAMLLCGCTTLADVDG